MLLNSLEEEKLRLAFESIDSNTPTIINRTQYENSIFDRSFMIENAKVDDYEYKTDFNRVGQHIIFKGTQKILKFYIPINLFCKEDEYEERKKNNILQPINNKVSRVNRFNHTIFNGFPQTDSDIEDIYNTLKTSEERGKMNRPTLEVYVNGYKIPDRYILLTIVNGTTDVYFESKYLTEESNEIVFVIKKYDTIHPYKTYLYEQPSDITLDTFEDDNRYDVYKNGCYQIKNKHYEIKNGQIVFLNTSRSNDIIEIRENYEYSFADEYLADNFSGIIYTENLRNYKNKLLDIYNKTISKDIIELYVNGRRYFANKIDDLSATYFLIKDDFSTPKEVFFRINLELDEKNYNNIDYLDAYNKATNFFKSKISVDSLTGKSTVVRTPEYFNLKNLNDSFSPIYLGNKVKNPIELINTRKEYFLAMLKNYVLMNSYYFKHIVEFFKEPRERYEFLFTDNNIEEYTRLDNSTELSNANFVVFDTPKVVFQVALNNSDKTHFLEKLFINKKFAIPNVDYITFTNAQGMFFMYINKELISDNCLVECFIERSNYKDVQSFKFTYNNHQSEKIQIFDLSDVGIIKENVNNLIVSYKNEDLDNYVIMDTPNYELTIVKVEGKEKVRLRIISDVKPNTKFSVYNNLFLKRTIFNLENFNQELMEESNIIKLKDIFPDIENEPFIKREHSKNNIEIYLNNHRLFEKFHYDIIVPSETNRINEPIIIIKIKFNENDKLTILNKETIENIVESKTKISSKYGLLYLPNLKFPFSSSYIDTYVNGTKIDAENIEFVANNVIKLKNVENIKNVILMSNVNMSEELIDEFYQLVLLNKDSFEEYLKGILEEGKLDDTWEDVKDNEEDLKPIPPSENDEEVVDVPFNKLVEAWIEGIIQKRLDCNKEIPEEDIQNNLFFDFFIDNIIQINANYNLIYTKDPTPTIEEDEKNSMGFDANENYYSIDDISEIFYKEEIKKPNENIDGDLDNFDDSNMNKYIYIENKIELDANKLVLNNNDNVDLDANEDLEEDDGVIVFDANMF